MTTARRRSRPAAEAFRLDCGIRRTVNAASAVRGQMALQASEIASTRRGTPDALSPGMMLKFLPLTALALGLSSGVALADRHGGDHRSFGGDRRAAVVEHRAPVARDHREWHGGGGAYVRAGGDWHRGTVVREGRGFYSGGRGYYGGSRVVVRDRPYFRGVVRRPIFVSRPIIRDHYYNYYRRPALIVENFAPMDGYYWVPGHWSWNGYEWLWEPGHYQPDPNYFDSGYADPGYGY